MSRGTRQVKFKSPFKRLRLIVLIVLAGDTVLMSSSQDSTKNCQSFFALATEGSIPWPGSGSLKLYDYGSPWTQNLKGTAKYTSASLVFSSGSCEWTYGFNSTKKNVATASGLIRINATKIVGSADPCYKCTNFAYWYLWTAIGDIAWVPLSTAPTEPCYTSLFKVTDGSTLQGGTMDLWYVARDQKITEMDRGFATATYSSTGLSLTSGTCNYTYTELMDAVTVSSLPKPGPSSSSSSTAASPSTPAPSPTTTSYQVKLSLLFQMSVASFNANTSMQQALKENMAVTAGLTRADASRVQLAARAARRRQLLADTATVDVTINMPDAASATKAATLLTPPPSRRRSCRRVSPQPPSLPRPRRQVLPPALLHWYRRSAATLWAVWRRLPPWQPPPPLRWWGRETWAGCLRVIVHSGRAVSSSCVPT